MPPRSLARTSLPSTDLLARLLEPIGADRGRRAPRCWRSGGRPGGAHDPSYRSCQDSPVAPSSTWTRGL